MCLQADRTIPGLEPLPEPRPVDVAVFLGGELPRFDRLTELSRQPWYISSNLDESGAPVLKVWRLAADYFRLIFCDGIEFVVDRRGTRVWANWPEKAAMEEVAVYLLGAVSGFLLRLRGITCLHASSVAVGRQAIALLGHPGAGKSTTAAAFARLGHPVLTDDILPLHVLEREIIVYPGTPRLCLWPSSVTHLWGFQEALPRITPPNGVDPEWDKRYLHLLENGYRFQEGPLPLKALYFLGERREEGALNITPVTGREALLELVANSYATKLLDKAMRIKEFGVLSQLVNTIPLRRVTPHPDLAYLPELCDAIMKDFQYLSPNCHTSPQVAGLS